MAVVEQLLETPKLRAHFRMSRQVALMASCDESVVTTMQVCGMERRL